MFDTKITRNVLKSAVRQAIPIYIPKKIAHDGLIASPHAGNGTYRATKNQLFQCSFQVLIFCNRLAWLHTYRHTYIHTGRQAGRRADRQTGRCIHTYIRTYVRTYVRTYIHACMHTCIHAYMHTCIHADMQTCRHADIQTYIQSLKRTLTYGINITQESHGIGAQQLDQTGPLVKLLDDWVD